MRDENIVEGKVWLMEDDLMNVNKARATRRAYEITSSYCQEWTGSGLSTGTEGPPFSAASIVGTAGQGWSLR